MNGCNGSYILWYVRSVSAKKNPTFFVSKSRKLNFISLKKINSRGNTVIIRCIKKDCNKYSAHGFKITDVHRDNEFASPKIEEALLPILMHIYAKNEHVGFIENCIKTIKERSQLPKGGF